MGSTSDSLSYDRYEKFAPRVREGIEFISNETYKIIIRETK